MSFQCSKTKSIFCVIFLLDAMLFWVGCKSTRDRTADADRYSDYLIGQVYEIRTYVFIHKFNRNDAKEIGTLEKLGESGTVADAQKFIEAEERNVQVIGLVTPGQKLAIVRILENRSPTIGPVLHVYAKIKEGKFDGMIVDLSMLSRRDLERNRIMMNPEYLSRLK